MLKCGFVISKAIKSNPDSIASASQLKTCCRLQGVGVGCKARLTPDTLLPTPSLPLLPSSGTGCWFLDRGGDPNQVPDPHGLRLHPQQNQRASESRFCFSEGMGASDPGNLLRGVEYKSKPRTLFPAHEMTQERSDIDDKLYIGETNIGHKTLNSCLITSSLC